MLSREVATNLLNVRTRAHANGTGCVTQLRIKNEDGTIRKSRYWYLLYYVNGRQIRESSKTESKMQAEALLQVRLGEAQMGVRPHQDVKQLKYEDVRDALLAEYENQHRGSLFTAADGHKYIPSIKHLDNFFKRRRCIDINTDLIRKFIAHRRAEGAADPTVRKNLTILRSMLNMARKEGKLRGQDVPHFPMPKDSDPAGQYLEPQKFSELLGHLPENLHPFFTFMYYTGCRVGAVKNIRWTMVNKDCDEIKIPAELMKARTPLTLVLAGAGLEPVSKMLKKMFRLDDDAVFDHTNYRWAWQTACHAVGVGVQSAGRRYKGLRIHDLRCSAAINLVDGGVPEDIAMKIGSWKTREMFSRYNVINTKRIRDAMVRGGEYVRQKMNQA
jgi:integrase